MIVVNLLPKHLRPIKRTPLPHILSIAVLMLAIAGMAFIFFAKAGEIAGARHELAKTEQELDALKEIVDDYNKLSTQKQQLENKINVIQEILKDRIIWSEQLHRLVWLTPDNFWYSRIRVTSKTVRQEEVVIDEKTGQPAIDPRTKLVRTTTVNVRQPLLEISGYIIPNEEGSNQVFPLMYSTAGDDPFSRVFELERPQFGPAVYNGYDLNSFVLEYLIEAGGDL